MDGIGLLNETISGSNTQHFKRASLKNNNKFLRQINVSSQRDLTPKCRKLFKEAMNLKKKSERLTRNKNKFKSRLRLAEKFGETSSFTKIINKLNTTTFNFFKSQINSQTKQPKGRRYSIDDKILSLSIYKNSPKAYRFLSTLFALPSKKTLTNLLNQVPFKAGINEHIFKNLTHHVSKLKLNNRLCSLVFDEMAIEPDLFYCKKEDMVYGFENFGENEKYLKICDHVLVFLIRGINKKWKQPVAYYFCQSTTKTPQLVKCITEVIEEIQKTGLKVMSTVCDQGTSNVKAIKLLKQSTKFIDSDENRYVGFKINEQLIIPIFDPPHLLKTIRNNLMTKNLIFTKNNIKYTASWNYIIDLYKLDVKNEVCGLRTLPKLTELHVIPEKVRKMRVSIAAQTLSQRVAATMRLMADYGKI